MLLRDPVNHERREFNSQGMRLTSAVMPEFSSAAAAVNERFIRGDNISGR